MEKRKKSSSNSKKVIIFLACSKTKKKYKCPAKELYQGQLFQKAYKFSSKEYPNIFVLSAKYGIIHIDDIIEPYEKTLNKMTPVEIKNWYILVQEQMKELGLDKYHHIFYASRLYCEVFIGEKPIYGLKYGECLKWFKDRENNKKRLL